MASPPQAASKNGVTVHEMKAIRLESCRKVFIPRDYAHGLNVHFETQFPPIFRGKVCSSHSVLKSCLVVDVQCEYELDDHSYWIVFHFSRTAILRVLIIKVNPHTIPSLVSNLKNTTNTSISIRCVAGKSRPSRQDDKTVTAAALPFCSIHTELRSNSLQSI